jgi:hypothetical protein
MPESASVRLQPVRSGVAIGKKLARPIPNPAQIDGTEYNALCSLPIAINRSRRS